MDKRKGLGITKVGLPVLKRDEIVEYLNDDKIISKDTKSVSGIPSDRIAVSSHSHGRDTVNNALNLGGIHFKNFLQKGDVDSLFKFAKEVSNTHMNEIRSLKDELYQTKASLINRGHIVDENLYHGFVDNFNKISIKYDAKKYEILNTIADDTHVLTLKNEDISDFYVGEKIAIITESNNDLLEGDLSSTLDKDKSTDVASDVYSVIHTIKDISGNDIITEEPLMNIDSNISMIFKTAGEYQNGSFIFAKPMKNIVTGKERKTTFLDDINIRKRNLYRRGEGFAVRFKIDQILNGALKDFSIKANKIGNPGGLECFIIEEKDMDKFNNIEDVIEKDKENKMIIARSSKIEIDNRGLVTFNFKDSNGRYPLIDVNSRERHCAIIVCNSQNESQDESSGRWEITFSASNPDGSDLYLHNNTYRFKDRVRHDLSPLEKGIYVDPELKNLELNYVLTSIETLKEGYEPYTEGIYTKKYKLPLNNKSTNIRVSMRGNKESNFISSSNVIVKQGETIPVIIKNNSDGKFSDDFLKEQDFSVDIGDTIIIGEHPFIIKEGLKGNGQIKVSPINMKLDFIKIKQGDPVFRIDYKVFIRGYDTEEYTDDYGKESERIVKVIKKEVPIVGSVVDNFYNSKTSTNRIIFDTDFILNNEDTIPNELKYFDIQILWNSKYTKNEIKNAISKDFYGLIGRIDDLAVSFNKSIYASDIFDNDTEEEPSDLVDKKELNKWRDSLNSILEQSNFILSIREEADKILNMPETTQLDVDTKTNEIKNLILDITGRDRETIIVSTLEQKESIQEYIVRISENDLGLLIDDFIEIQSMPQYTVKESKEKILALEKLEEKISKQNIFKNKLKEIEDFIRKFENSEIVRFYIDDQDILKPMRDEINNYYYNKENIKTLEEASEQLDILRKENNKLLSKIIEDMEKINNRKFVLVALLNNEALVSEEDFVKDTMKKIKNLSGSRIEQHKELDKIEKEIRDMIKDLSGGGISDERLDELIEKLNETYKQLQKEKSPEDDNTKEFILEKLKDLEEEIKRLYGTSDEDEIKEIIEKVNKELELIKSKGYKIIIKEYGKNYTGKQLTEEEQLQNTNIEMIEELVDKQMDFLFLLSEEDDK